MRLRRGKSYETESTPINTENYKRSSDLAEARSRRRLNSSLNSVITTTVVDEEKDKSILFETKHDTIERRNYAVNKESFRYSYDYKKTNARHMASMISENNGKDDYLKSSIMKSRGETILTSTPLQKSNGKKHVSFIDDMPLTLEEREPVNTKVDFKMLSSSSSEEFDNYSKGMLQKESSEYLNTLETFIFHDISYSNIGTIWSDDDYLHINNFSKLDGSLNQHFEDEDMNVNASFSINHVNRSRFRQNRREWYLNRRISSHMSTKRSSVLYYFHSYFILKVTNFISSIISKFQWIIKKGWYSQRKMGYYTSALWTFISIIHSIFTYVANYLVHSVKGVKRLLFSQIQKRKSTGYIFNKYEESSQTRDPVSDAAVTKISNYVGNDVPLVLCWSFVLFVFGLLCFLPLLFGVTLFIADNLLILPMPKELGIQNAYAFILDDASTSIPLYHIRPPQLRSLPINKSFEYNLPIMLYLPKSDVINNTHQLQVYDVLSSLAYHILVPYQQLAQSDIHVIWKWLMRKAPTAKIYMWGDHIDSRIIAGHAKSLCEKLLPPSGCIMATESYHAGKQFRNLEFWSCNCTTLLDEKSSVFSYNNVKCPLTSSFSNDELYFEIVSCVEALSKTK